MRTINTYYEFNGERKPFVMFIDDGLANTIINSPSAIIQTISNVNTFADFAEILDIYLGSYWSAMAIPYNSNGDEVNKTAITTLFPNAFEVNGQTSIGPTSDTCSFAGKPLMCMSDPINVFVNMYPENTTNDTYYATPLSIYSSIGSGGNVNITFGRFFIFKESEIVDGKINITDTEHVYRQIQFQWAKGSNKVYINRIFATSASGNNMPNFTYFNDSDIPYPTPESTDPYNPSHGGPGYSGTGGGPSPSGGTGTTGTGGLHDDTSDPIPTPSLPTDVTISSGLFTAYNPSASQLASFASALWNMQPTDINDVLRFLFGGDAFNAVIGLHLLPVAPSTGGSTNIKLGNWDTNVSAPKINSQYKQVPFGSVLLPEYWGNCIDYAPYTKIQLALPYIGIVDVDTDDVLGSTNTLTYNIDVLSGAICATLHCVKFNLSSVIYQWSGACAVSLPFSGASYNSVLGAIAGIAAAGMGFASMAAGPIGAALPAAALAVGGGAFGAGSAASIMGTMKGKVQKSGSFGANSGALGIMTPYFILTRPVQSVPETWQADKGYPSNISAQLGTVTGYTEVSEINLECSGTEAEKKEIIDLLKKGVLF